MKVCFRVILLVYFRLLLIGKLEVSWDIVMFMGVMRWERYVVVVFFLRFGLVVRIILVMVLLVNCWYNLWMWRLVGFFLFNGEIVLLRM